MASSHLDQEPEFLYDGNSSPSGSVGDLKYRAVFEQDRSGLEVQRIEHSGNAFQLKSGSQLDNVFQIPQLVPTKGKIVLQETISCPEKPYRLVRTNFSVNTSTLSVQLSSGEKYRKLVDSISSVLLNFSEYDFNYFSQQAMWKGKYIQGSTSCDLNIQLYSDKDEKYIVECNRLKGESKPFHSFFRGFKEYMTGIADNRPENQLFIVPLEPTSMTNEQFIAGIRPVCAMAMESFFESRLEAAKMLCDLSSSDHKYLQLRECVVQCVAALSTLIEDEFDGVRQHAIVAFASFVEVPGYQEEMVKSDALKTIAALVDNAAEPAYETIQVRRESARIISTLSAHNSASLCENFTKNGVRIELLIERVGKIQDKRLLTHAIRARDNIIRSLAMAGGN